MKLIPIHELLPGMILGEDLYGKFDLLYAGKGDTLNDKMIEGLKRLGTQSVYIDDGDVTPAFESVPPADSATATTDDPLKDYTEIISSLYTQYASFKLLNKSVLTRIEEPSSKLLDFVLTDPGILKLLSKVMMIDGYTLNHSVQVSLISTLIGQWLGLSVNDQFKLGYAGLLHDVGKSKIPVHVLNKPSKLSPEEYEAIKKHSEFSVDQIKGLPQVNEDIRSAVLHHHEKTDGTGYPMGLSGDAIHFYAQILCIADIYSAMTTDKVYNRKFTPLKAAEEVYNASFSNKVNPEIANLFLRNIYRMLVGSQVRLSNGQEGEIVYFNRFSPAKPLVKIGEEFVDLYREKDLVIVEIL